MNEALSIEQLRRHALARLPRVIADYLEGGADDEVTVRANRAAFERWRLVPKVATGAGQVDLSVTLFGQKLGLPFMVGPTGMNGIFWSGGDLCLARAASRRGTGFVLPLASNATLEDVAQAGPAVRWFQLYPWGTPQHWRRLLERAREHAYTALVVTVDTPVPGNRERDRAHGFAHKVRITPRVALDGLLHPRWLASVWLRGAPAFVNLREAVGARASAGDLAAFTRSARRPDFAWPDLAEIRRMWQGPMLVKGVLHPADVAECRRIGADGVVVSNHGGRQLDHALPSIEALAPIREQARGMVVIVDSGFRRGSDIVKALALGADAVFLGRAVLYGLAARGQAGAEAALRILEEEVRRAMVLLGAPDVCALDAGCLAVAREN